MTDKIAMFRDHEGLAVYLKMIEVSPKVYALATSDTGGPTGQFGYVQITDLSSPTSLDIPPGATQAMIIAEGADYRYRLDGVAPTATIGMPMTSGSILTLNGGELAGFHAIEQSEGCILNVLFEG